MFHDDRHIGFPIGTKHMSLIKDVTVKYTDHSRQKTISNKETGHRKHQQKKLKDKTTQNLIHNRGETMFSKKWQLLLSRGKRDPKVR
jgi:hypothetical protein